MSEKKEKLEKAHKLMKEIKDLELSAEEMEKVAGGGGCVIDCACPRDGGPEQRPSNPNPCRSDF